MKVHLFSFFLFFATSLYAKNYYISAAGNDANDGLTVTTPWKSINKLNASWAVINPGDNVYFRRGDTFYGSVVIGKAGTAAAMITISNYGSGPLPIITGFSSASGWSLVSPGIYKTALKAKYNLNIVTLNDIPQRVGRYPNYNSTDGGFITYTAFTGNTTLTAAELSATTWTGGEVVSRKEGYILERDSITAQSGGTITYTAIKTINPRNNGSNTTAFTTSKAGYGLFIQRHIKTLDQVGEWYFNSPANELNMFFGATDPNSVNVKVSTVDTLINIGTKNFISINGLSLEGANLAAIYFADAGNLVIKNNQISYSGAKGIFGWNSSNVVVEGNSIKHSMCGSIDIVGRYAKNCYVYKNTVKNSGCFAGMGSFFDDADYKAVYISVDSIAVIRKNNIDTTGYSSIQFQGSGIMVDSNFINYFCFVKDDGGGVYTFGSNKKNRTVKNNIIINGIGAPFGNASATHAEGIYCDQGTSDVLIINNTCAYIHNKGVYFNDPKNINVRGNTVFSSEGWGVNKHFNQSIFNFKITKNIFFSTDKAKNFGAYSNDGLNSTLVPVASTIEQAMEKVGIIDSNIYNIVNPTGLSYQYQAVNGGAWTFPKPLTYEGWKVNAKHDVISKLTPVKFADYQIDALLTGNVLTTGQFNNSISGTTVWSSTPNITYSWDNTSKISGTGSLKIVPAAPSTNYTLLYGSVGAVSSSKQYILRVTTMGSTETGVMKAYIRKSASPQTTLIPAQIESFGTAKQVHEFLFTGPANEVAASFLIEIQQASGTTYVDDIEFYEAKATYQDVNSLIRFEYNATDVAKTITLDAKYVGVDSAVYNSSVTIQPFTSLILLKTGNILKVDAGSDVILNLPANSATLKGTASGVVSYTWSKISGPSQFTISSSNTANTVVSNLVAGSYTFLLKVTNSTGDTASATIKVLVAGVLPVKLSDFTAVNNNDVVDIKWQTSLEVNVSHYIIERSSDGQKFEGVGQVVSGNKGVAIGAYAFQDNFPGSGDNFYRLAMVDKDGTIEYSKTVKISIKKVNAFSLQNLAIANAGSTLKIGINSNYQQEMNILVSDVSGKILVKSKLQLQKGFNALNSNIPSTSTGVYYVKMFTPDQTLSKAVLGGQ